jgi:alkanesulfonate monooxygenase SsuD/methylene tetrahydromethanopterin reductase-like flavin-dependent oxidoreductase (luciferase family)
VSFSVHFDLRAPSFGAPIGELYAAALDMAAWADEHGAMAVVLSEHHGVDDGYLPSAMTMAAAVAARTRSAMVSVNALPLTMHDPVAVAEQAVVVDLLAGGRFVLTVVPGYVPSELAMFDVAMADRARVLDEKLDVLVRAMAGERFEWRGRPVHVTPRGARDPRPLVLVGGSSKAAARRAARFGDGFSPTNPDPALGDAYRAECAALGRPEGLVFSPPTPLFVHVAEDVEAAWAALRPHAEHELRSYREWSARDPGSPYASLADADAARAAGLWAVLTPEECVALARSGGALVVKPLLGGLDPAIGWSCLHLLAQEVLPKL